MFFVTFLTFSLSLSLTLVSGLNTTTISSLISATSCAQLYEKGIEAYLENDFERCVHYLEASVEKYRQYSRSLHGCRIECKDRARDVPFLYEENIEDLQFYEKTLRNTLCILKCRASKFLPEEYNLNPETETIFIEKKPYEYLQLCYFQIEEYQKCASAAFTYLVYHPDDKIMLTNLKHYSKLPGVDVKDIVNFEAQMYVYLYVHGSDAHINKNWDDVIQNMEESITYYLYAEEECRASCEGPFNQGWFPDFIPSIANHFAYSLRCKRRCPEQLSSLNGEKYDDLYPSHYHYLQYAYFKTDKLKEACAAVETYLMFYPNDEVMMSNKEYYLKLDVKKEWFKPREEAEEYFKRDLYEKRLFKFIMKEFNEELDKKRIRKGNKIKVSKNAKDLNGTHRYLAEDVLTESECTSLIYLAKLFALPGDGYIGNRTPHTLMENFEGVTLSRTSLLTYVGMLNANDLKLIIKVTEDAKNHIQYYFELNRKLYFTYTHLVCRSPVPGSPSNRTDFSHVVHADNCNLKKNLKCEKEYPSYTYRDYSAIIYLNDDFDGGEFVFVSDFYGKQLESTIIPKCGRMVAFSSGNENLHAVKAVTKGSRCALAVWFTFDKKYSENRNFAYQILKGA
nr:prolyl 3-hydroxylase 1-like [Onthophagus taurus]